MGDPIAKCSDRLARRVSRRDVGGRFLQFLFGAGLALFGGGSALARPRGRCRHLKGGCARCGWFRDGCGGYPKCQKRGYECNGGGLECPDGCQYTTYWSCCCEGVVYRCTDCKCEKRICICRGATESIC